MSRGFYIVIAVFFWCTIAVAQNQTSTNNNRHGVVKAGSVAPNATPSASNKQQFVVKAGSVAPEGTPWAAWLGSVRKRVEKDSKGAVKLKMFLGGKLGGERQIIEETKRGNVQMFGGSVGAIAAQYVPELNVFELPYLFEGDEEVDFVLNALRDHVSGLLSERGFVFSMWSENGWHGYATKKKCLKSPKDLVGLRMRSQESYIHLNTYKAFGATPVEMAVPEVLSALERGVVDGYSNTMIVTFALGWYRPVSYFTYTKHMYQPGIIVFSKKWFDGLPNNLQKILKDDREEKVGIAQIRALSGPLKQNLTAAGVTICELDSSERALFQSKVKSVWEGFAKKSPSSKAILDKVLEAKKQFAEGKKA